MTFHFAKYSALGNDMIVIDPARCDIPLTPANIRLICDRHFGVGADGICYGPLAGTAVTTPALRFFNPDGSEAERSGNGLRIFARYVADAHYQAGSEFTLSMGGTFIPAQIDGKTGSVTLLMGELQVHFLDKAFHVGEVLVQATAVSIGNPHCVIFTPQLERIHTWGPLIETAPSFPHHTNVQLAHVLDAHTLQIEIWERGAGYTLASGTSASAAAAAAVHTGRCTPGSPITVKMAGGEMTVDVLANGVRLMGAVTAVYQGQFAPDFLAALTTPTPT